MLPIHPSAHSRVTSSRPSGASLGLIFRRSIRVLVLAFSSGVGLGLHAAPVNAIVKSVQGQAEVAAPGTARYTPLKVGQTVPIGSTIRTGENGQAVLVATPGSAILIGADSILRINDLAFTKKGESITERRAELDLKTGSVSALIDPSTPKITDFKIQTPQGAAAARGTFYAVVVKNGKTYLGVKEGKVAALASSR